MGMMTGIIAGGGAVESLTRAAQGISQVFVPNATEGQRLDHEGRAAALEQLSGEFELERRGLFDRFVDGLNRLPRPMLALGTLGLFVYAMAEPVGFGVRMEGLSFVPEPLWWLLGAIVGFYFGARELHYLRPSPPKVSVVPDPVHSAWHVEEHARAPAKDAAGMPVAEVVGDAVGEAVGDAVGDVVGDAVTDALEDNAALRDWRSTKVR